MKRVILASTCQYCGQMYGVKIIAMPEGKLAGLVENDRIKTFGICEGCMISYHINLIDNKTINNMLGRD